jgi:predicted nucleic acid-binding protein
VSENDRVPRFVIDSGATLHLAGVEAQVSSEQELLAPTLWRSETLSALYQAVTRGELAAEVARERIAYVNGLKIRLLGDAVLRRRAWELALELELDTTYPAEYVALAQLQKGTLVSTDDQLLERVGHLVPTAPVDVLG